MYLFAEACEKECPYVWRNKVILFCSILLSCAARRGGLSGAEQQEQKRLQRKQQRIQSKRRGKNKGKDAKATAAPAPTDVATVSPRPSKPIINKDGKMVFSKFDFVQAGEWTGALLSLFSVDC